MVLGLLTAIAACPAIVGTTEAVRQGQRTNAKEKHRGVKSNLIVSCARTSSAGRYIDGCSIVLSDNKVRCLRREPTQQSLSCSLMQLITSYTLRCLRWRVGPIYHSIHSQDISFPIPNEAGVAREKAWFLRSAMSLHN